MPDKEEADKRELMIVDGEYYKGNEKARVFSRQFLSYTEEKYRKP